MELREILRVLVVDDMSTSRGLLRQALDALGVVNVVYAQDGEAAVVQARKTATQLVLSDLHMPKMNGLQLLQHLRGDPHTRKVAFILVTGHDDPSVLATARALGMNGFLKKPFTLLQLRDRIEDIVGRL